MTTNDVPEAFERDQIPVANPIDQVPRDARQFQGHRAGVVTRTVANSIDFAVVLGILLGMYAVWFSVDFIINTTDFTPPNPKPTKIVLVGMGVLWLYLVIAWSTVGRTVGDLIMGLRVVNWKGDKMHWLGAVLRSLFCVWFIPGFFWVAISRKNKSVQDIALRTSVIYDWTRRMPKVPDFEGSTTPSGDL